MRTRTLLATLILMVIWSVSSGGCQIVSGLTVLQVTGGSGGEGAGGGGSGGEGTGGGGGGAECAEPCPMNYGCNPKTLECNDHCTTYSDCSSTGFCVTPAEKCESCGIYPPMSPPCMPGSGSCETCSDDACVRTCDVVGECNGSNKTLDAGMRPARLVCNGQCNSITVTCQGPYPCEVVCDSNGCNGLTMQCSNDGPCKITCTDTACTGKGVIMKCGENECGASCTGDSGAMVEQVCGGSCGCSKTGCQ